MTEQFDEAVLDAFLAQQEKLYPEKVAEDRESAAAFLGESLAVVAEDLKELREYLEEVGVDISGMEEADIAEAEEVFSVGDGRYLVVEV
ncbi:MAG: glyoxalase [Lachnospiraceae bacterium]|nr:glyoxalase [Lachnospiraceae bacterium]